MVVGYKISSDTKQMDLSDSYWAKGVSLSTMQTAVSNSFCFGVFTDAGQQVAFARMITDYATFAYLADVFVLPEHRGKGVSKWLLQTIIDDPKLQKLRQVLLATNDAHNLYKQFGFSALASPALFMELHRPDIYQKKCNT
ncbi:GNAT family N-acetyltransferase [Psychromonas sp. 14N.309.X.WAT.B.A12]|jgi:N-acetylglutamate synthase-like GNAT family acetyltransferase|uniref:GNAT family N-acetyltransferase n=1 Tax=Psychromonas sp. 14N.309.X.WAT.B.A12 TaxID=2998322 RepID=UPI0025B0E0EF|nr:GNAT family N-acetyltransferase [Psychromonas sp. 14N.309.X.WAT.B.A12]MDN2663900.1 GNAT family N-acetyltransferase [Psychromonas sp. 14N.309.X.WAT.B.A12]